jgi:hypothetical protein
MNRLVLMPDAPLAFAIDVDTQPHFSRYGQSAA